MAGNKEEWGRGRGRQNLTDIESSKSRQSSEVLMWKVIVKCNLFYCEVKGALTSYWVNCINSEVNVETHSFMGILFKIIYNEP